MDSEYKNIAVVTDFKSPQLIDLTEELASREIQEGEVLIKIISAPINPSDQMMVEGVYGNPSTVHKKEYGYGLGFEGAGEIVKAHDSLPADLVGKKVAFTNGPSSPNFQGTWRQFIFMKNAEIIPFPDDSDLNKICCSIVNPFTACGFVDYYIKGGHKAMIHDAACSSLGKMLIKLCKNIVRREEQVETLKSLGAEYIVNSSLDTFKTNLKEMCTILEPTIFFDAIGGDITGQVLDCMPFKSTAYVYGLLSNKPISYSPGKMIHFEKTISYFWLGPWLTKISLEEKIKWISEVIEDINSGGEIFGSKVYQTFPLSKFEEALKAAVEHASEGKILFKPQEE